MTWDDEKFAAVFEENFSGLSRYLEGVLGRDGAAPEIAQEALLRLYQSGPRSIAPGEERFWIYRVATNLAFNELRRAAVRRRLGAVANTLLGASASDPHGNAVRAERDGQLTSALADLPKRRRAAFLLRERDGMSYAEIARVLGISLSLVRTEIFRARSSLREALHRADGNERRSAIGGRK